MDERQQAVRQAAARAETARSATSAFAPLAERWWRSYLLVNSDRREDRKAAELLRDDAYEKVLDIVGTDVTDGVDLVLALVYSAPNDDVGAIAAGPLEVLFVAHDEQAVAQLTPLLGVSEPLRRAVASVTFMDPDDMTPVVSRLVQTARGS